MSKSKPQFAPAVKLQKLRSHYAEISGAEKHSAEISPLPNVLEPPKLVRQTNVADPPQSLFSAVISNSMASPVKPEATAAPISDEDARVQRRHELWSQVATKLGAKFVKKGSDMYGRVMKEYILLCEEDPLLQQPRYRWKQLGSDELLQLDEAERKKYFWDFACRSIQGLLDNEYERTAFVRKTDENYPAVRDAYIGAAQEFDALVQSLGAK